MRKRLSSLFYLQLRLPSCATSSSRCALSTSSPASSQDNKNTNITSSTITSNKNTNTNTTAARNSNNNDNNSSYALRRLSRRVQRIVSADALAWETAGLKSNIDPTSLPPAHDELSYFNISSSLRRRDQYKYRNTPMSARQALAKRLSAGAVDAGASSIVSLSDAVRHAECCCRLTIRLTATADDDDGVGDTTTQEEDGRGGGICANSYKTLPDRIEDLSRSGHHTLCLSEALSAFTWCADNLQRLCETIQTHAHHVSQPNSTRGEALNDGSSTSAPPELRQLGSNSNNRKIDGTRRALLAAASSLLVCLGQFLRNLVSEGLLHMTDGNVEAELRLASAAASLVRAVSGALAEVRRATTNSSSDDATSVFNKPIPRVPIGVQGYNDSSSLLRIADDIIVLAVCTQREDCHTAVELAALLTEFNNNKVLEASSTAPSTKEEDSGDVTPVDSDAVIDAHLSRMMRCTGSAVSLDVLLTTLYVLAQHGRLDACEQLEQYLAHVGNAAEHMGTVKTLISLAKVNSENRGADVLPELSTLVRYGMYPNRPISLPEFDCLLRHITQQQKKLHEATGDKKKKREGRRDLLLLTSPFEAWHRTRALPYHVRATLCLAAHQVLSRHSMAQDMTVEDVYVVLSVSRWARRQRQGLRQRWLHIMSQSMGEESQCKTAVFNKDVPSACTNGSAAVGGADVFDFFGGAAPLFLVGAARATVPHIKTHLVQLCKVYVTLCDQRTTTTTAVPNHMHQQLHDDHHPVARKECMPTTLRVLSQDVMTALKEVRYEQNVGSFWEAALCALTALAASPADCRRRVEEPFSADLDALALSLALSPIMHGSGDATTPNTAAQRSSHLLGVFVQLAPDISPYTVATAVQSGAGRYLSWQQCAQLMQCVPLGSRSQRQLLRRVAQDRSGGGAVPHLLFYMPSRNTTIATASSLSSPPPPQQQQQLITADEDFISIMTSTHWQTALGQYVAAASRTQAASAPHVARLVVEADAWAALPEGAMLLRLAVRGPTAYGGGEVLVEGLLRTLLSLGRWHSGLQLHQRVQREHPLVVRRSVRAQRYAAQLCCRLMERTALARTMAVVTRATRRGQWQQAASCFMEYACGDNVSKGINTNKDNNNNNAWPFHILVPPELSHFSQAVRFAMMQHPNPILWDVALRWFPPAVLPVPVDHLRLWQSHRLTGGDSISISSSSRGIDGNAIQGIDGNNALVVGAACPTFPSYNNDSGTALVASTTTTTASTLIEAARRACAVHRPEQSVLCERRDRTSAALQEMRHRGQWAHAVTLYKEALQTGCMPYRATATVLRAVVDGGGPWELALSCFIDMSQRTQPDVFAVTAALEACAIGNQWETAFKVLKHSVITQPYPVPRAVDLAVSIALHCGAWARALKAVETYRATRSPHLAHTILVTYVAAKRWSTAVEYFYDCSIRGMPHLDASVELALVASDAVGDEYRHLAAMVAAIASTLEDLYTLTGIILEHILFVHRSRKNTQWAQLPRGGE